MKEELGLCSRMLLVDLVLRVDYIDISHWIRRIAAYDVVP